MSRRRGDTSVLVTLLFTDIVGSTEIAAELGDRRWRDLIRRHHEVVRRHLKRYGGRELDTAGDGFFARFDRPADAIRCAIAISEDVRELGIEVRAGLHVGEAEVLEGKVGGMAVNVAARVMGAGKAGEVLVSSTARDAVSGSGFEFADHGVHQLKGIQGEWRLYEVMAVDGVHRSAPLSEEDARTRRSFIEGRPVDRHRERVVAAALGAAAVALAVVALSTGIVGDERRPVEGGPSEAERALLQLIPIGVRETCEPDAEPPLGAVAAVACEPTDQYTVSFSRFTTADDLEAAFQGFASPADPTNVDCSRDPSAVQPYSENGTPAGRVACYVEEGEGPSTTDSVIVWTNDELLVLGRAVRGDAADLTLYEWWRTVPGPSDSSAVPTRDGEPEVLEGEFRSPRGWTITFSDGRYRLDGIGPYGGTSTLLFSKPQGLLVFHRLPPQTFGGAVCPSYEVYRWRLRGPQLSLRIVSGGCREYESESISRTTWRRVG